MSGYDAFISYNSHDRTPVEALVQRLRTAGFKVWFDVTDMVPGRSAVENMLHGLQSTSVCLVCVGSSGSGPWQREEVEVAIADAVEKKSIRLLPVLLPGATRENVRNFSLMVATRNDWVYPERLEDPYALRKLMCAIDDRHIAPVSFGEAQVVRVGPGTGYALNAEMILTGASVVAETAAVDVTFYGENPARRARVFQRQADVGAALLQLVTSRPDVAKPPTLRRAPVPSSDEICVLVMADGCLLLFDGTVTDGVLTRLGGRAWPSSAEGAPVFVGDELVGVVGPVDEPAVRLIESNRLCRDPALGRALSAVDQRASTWVAETPSRSFEFLLHTAGPDGVVATLYDEDRRVLRTGPVYTEPLPPLVPSRLRDLASAARQGDEGLAVHLRSPGHREALGRYLLAGIFGSQTDLLETAGWGSNASCISQTASLCIRAEPPAAELLALPWRALTSGHTLLEDEPGWSISVSERPVDGTGTIERPCEVLLVALPARPGHLPSGQALDAKAHLAAVKNALVSIDAGFEDRIEFASSIDEFNRQVLMQPTLIYVYGVGFTGTDVDPGLSFYPDQLPVDPLLRALRQAQPEVVVLNLCEANDQGRFGLAARVADVAPFVVSHTQQVDAEWARAFGLGFLERLFRHAQDPHRAAVLASMPQGQAHDVTSTVVWSRRRAWALPFGPHRSQRSFLDVLHHLDRTRARSEVRTTIRDALTDFESRRPRGLGFVYLGRPGNLVDRFARGLFQDVDDDVGDDYTCVRLEVGPLPGEPSLSNFEGEIKVRIQHALRKPDAAAVREVFEELRAGEGPAVVWIDWGVVSSNPGPDWTTKPITRWHAAARQVLSFENCGIPDGALIVTTFGRELPDDDKPYAGTLRGLLSNDDLDAGRFQITVLEEFENIEVTHVKRLFDFAPDTFNLLESQRTPIAQIVAVKSKGVYAQAVALLQSLRDDGPSAFLDRYGVQEGADI